MQAKKKKNVKLKFRNRELKPDGFENDKLATYNVEWHNGEWCAGGRLQERNAEPF